MRRKLIPEILDQAHQLLEEEKIFEGLDFLRTIQSVKKFTPTQKVIYYTLVSKFYRILGDFSQAYENGKESLNFSHYIKNGIEKVDCFLNMARIIHFMGRNRECKDLLEKSTEILNDRNTMTGDEHNRRMGLLLFFKGHNAFKMGEWDKAVNLWKESIDFLEIYGSDAELARAYASFGITHIHKTEFDKGLLYLSKSQEICENK
jgi:tetratricopeptide (TPR) repeat protein